MKKYKLLGGGVLQPTGGVLDTERRMNIPNNPNNRHWQEYLGWLAEGNTPDPEFTQEEIAANELADRQAARMQTLQQATINQFEMILELFKKGRDNGAWTAQDFSPELRAKVQEWQDLIDAFKARTVSRPAITGRQEFIK